VTTILIVDDRPANREYLLSLLGYAGHRMLQAANGKDGLAAARAERPDLIITDVLMPTMDGYEFVRQLRADPAMANTPVIFYTAIYLEAAARQLAQACGVRHIVAGPLGTVEMLNAVTAILSGASAPASPVPSPADFQQEHLRLVTDKLAQKVAELEARTAELSLANARLQSLSLTDELTGLYNRRGFMTLATEQLLLARRAPRPLCLVYVDVDDLKSINDRHGHAAGDAALNAATQILRQTFRSSDIIARLGGDEFAVLVMDAAESSVSAIQARLHANLDLHNAKANGGFGLSLSLGSVQVDASATWTVEELLAEADRVMYGQKMPKRHKLHLIDDH
jgi:diguanylate cyclase (GGDEF)-like protein